MDVGHNVNVSHRLSRRLKVRDHLNGLLLVFPPWRRPSLSLCQMAVSHTTACGLWQGGVPVLRGSGVFLQLGRMGMLSCLHRLLSGRR